VAYVVGLGPGTLAEPMPTLPKVSGRLSVKTGTTPVITAGKIPTAEFAEELLREGKSDLIGLARPLLCDPDWVNKYLEGRPQDIVRCTYCNYCADLNALKVKPTNCILWPKRSIHPPDPFLPKKPKIT